jgi:hypothetical protein
LAALTTPSWDCSEESSLLTLFKSWTIDRLDVCWTIALGFIGESGFWFVSSVTKSLRNSFDDKDAIELFCAVDGFVVPVEPVDAPAVAELIGMVIRFPSFCL